MRAFLTTSSPTFLWGTSPVARRLVDGAGAVVALPLRSGTVRGGPARARPGPHAGRAAAPAAHRLRPGRGSRARHTRAAPAPADDEPAAGGVGGRRASPVLVAGPDRRLAVVNAAAATLLGVSPLEDGREMVAGLLGNEVLEGVLVGDLEPPEALLVVDPGGGEHVYTVVAAVAEGHRVVVLDDVTTRTELERTKADLVAVIGHELRTPITDRQGRRRCPPQAGAPR